jgi:hypothetical protein
MTAEIAVCETRSTARLSAARLLARGETPARRRSGVPTSFRIDSHEIVAALLANQVCAAGSVDAAPMSRHQAGTHERSEFCGDELHGSTKHPCELACVGRDPFWREGERSQKFDVD